MRVGAGLFEREGGFGDGVVRGGSEEGDALARVDDEWREGGLTEGLGVLLAWCFARHLGCDVVCAVGDGSGGGVWCCRLSWLCSCSSLRSCSSCDMKYSMLFARESTISCFTIRICEAARDQASHWLPWYHDVVMTEARCRHRSSPLRPTAHETTYTTE